MKTQTLSAPSFELSKTSALSRRLLRGSVVVAAPIVEQPPAAGKEEEGECELRHLVEAASTAADLWESLLNWAISRLDAESIFTLDQHGFAIAASSRNPMALPPEVFSAIFAETRHTLEAFMDPEWSIPFLEIEISGVGHISLFDLKSAEGEFFFGVCGRAPIRQDEILDIWAKIQKALSLYEDLIYILETDEQQTEVSDSGPQTGRQACDVF